MEKLKLTRVIHWITLIIIASGIIPISIADVTLTAPGEVTRGGMGDAGLGMDGHFDITVGGNGPFALGFIVNPMNMTGDYCDRLPYFSNGAGYVSGVVENEPVNPPIDRGNLELGTSSAVFKELIPTPDNFISNGCWEIPWNGSRYLGYGTGGTYTLNTTYPPEYGIMGLKPGTYTIHAQTIDGAINEFDTTKFAESEVTIRYGDLDIQFLDYNEFKKGNSLNIDWAYLSGSPGRVVIKGLNTDSFKTYLWLTGPNLPECGTGLQNVVKLPVTTMVPEILTLPNNPWGDDQQPTAPHKYIETSIGSGMYTGEWEYIWDISDIGLSPGNYTLYASSVDPSEALLEYCKGDISCKPDCSLNETCLNEGGVCSLLTCNKCCAPPVAIAEIELRAPPKAVISSIPDVTLCCCDEYPCESNNCGEIAIPLSGSFYIPRMPLQIWLFGNNLSTTGSGYIFSDNLSTLLNDEGYFEMDVFRDMLQKEGICPCDLEPGEYFVVIQTPYRYKNGKEIFDVTLEGSKAMSQITGPIVPGDQVKNIGTWKYVIESTPVYWTRSFAIEGEGALRGYDAFSSLINVLSKYNDPYYIIPFNITDRCNEYVDFIAEPYYGTTPLSVKFIDRSTINGQSREWDFGDGTTSIETNPEHIYRDPKKYTVTLNINTGSGTRATTKWNYISVVNDVDDSSKKMAADFDVLGPKVGTLPLTVQFVDKSEGHPVGWRWNFGDGQSSSLQSPVNIFRSIGPFTITLEVFDRLGNSVKEIKKDYVNVVSSSISASFRYTPDMTNIKNVHFEDLSEGKGINKWTWNFGDGTGLSTEQNPTYLYAENGCYTVTLKVENDVASDVRSYRICI